MWLYSKGYLSLPLLLLASSLSAAIAPPSDLDKQVADQFLAARNQLRSSVSSAAAGNEQARKSNADLAILNKAVENFRRGKNETETRNRRLEALEQLGTLHNLKSLQAFENQLQVMSRLSDPKVSNEASERLMDLEEHRADAGAIVRAGDKPLPFQDVKALRMKALVQQKALEKARHEIYQACPPQKVLTARQADLNREIAAQRVAISTIPQQQAALKKQADALDQQVADLQRKMGVPQAMARWDSLRGQTLAVTLDPNKVYHRKPTADDLKELEAARPEILRKLDFAVLVRDSVRNYAPPEMRIPDTVALPAGASHDVRKLADLADPKYQAFYNEKITNPLLPGVLFTLTPQGKAAWNGMLAQASGIFKMDQDDMGEELTQVALGNLKALDETRELVREAATRGQSLVDQRLALLDKMDNLPQQETPMRASLAELETKLQKETTYQGQCRNLDEWITGIDLAKDPKAIDKIIAAAGKFRDQGQGVAHDPDLSRFLQPEPLPVTTPGTHH